MMQPIRPMTDAQLEALRTLELSLVRTLFDGSLVVRDDEDALWNLGATGDLLPHVELDRTRIDPATL